MVITALDRKLLRDLSHMKGQVVTIALVVACGIAAFITFFGAYRSLRSAERTYYEAQRFADVFATCKRAPRELEATIAAIPGVGALETRVVVDVTLDMPRLDEPVIGRLISVPDSGGQILDVLRLREGRLLDPTHPDEVLVNEPFAREHALRPGSSVRAVVDGRVREYRVVGIALSPEYVFAITPSGTADAARFGVLWVSRDALSYAYDMQGAFDDVLIRVAPGGSTEAVISALDTILAPYGGTFAIPRKDQTSAHFLVGELDQLKNYATILPSIFVGVAAFLLHVVLSRLVGTQRDQIATLKAFGYSNTTVALHYLSMIAVIVLIGSVLGIGLGSFFGVGLTHRYAVFFRFPDLRFRLDLDVALIGTGITLVASALGAISAVRGAVRMTPAEAMRPESPARYRRSLLERLGLGPLLSGEGRMIVRSLGRRPFRAAVAMLGIALATAIVADAFFMFDSFDRLIAYQFHVVSREDATLSFRRQIDPSALRELRHLPGVLEVEEFRSVPVRFVAGHRTRKMVITGLPESAVLRRVVSTSGEVVVPPREGIILTAWLAERLGVAVGGMITVEVLEDQRVVRDVKVVAIVEEMIGVSAYMRLDALHRLLGEEEKITGARLVIDPRQQTALEAAIKQRPEVASMFTRARILQTFHEQTGEWMTLMSTILSMFAGVIAFGVVYNTARIALAERERELASLRVLGFTVGEITTIFVGELVVLIAVGVPLGCFVIARIFARLIVSTGKLESYRFPAILEPKSLAIAALVTAASGIASALVVRRKLDRLDLVAVLKSRD
ncbi:MAG: ABC transporter permease [Polyangiales bacterium]